MIARVSQLRTFSALPALRQTRRWQSTIGPNTHLTASARASPYFVRENKKDPYEYQVGFGNRFTSEAIPGTLPFAQNSPQKCKWDLYAEHVSIIFIYSFLWVNRRLGIRYLVYSTKEPKQERVRISATSLFPP